MTDRSTHHATFVVERVFAAPPARVFQAFADPVAKARWFIGPDDRQSSNHRLDFRVGGREHVSGGSPDGPSFSFDSLYQDIVPDVRIIYTYEMQMDGRRISVSVATIELRPAEAGTHLVVTEQGVFLDGLDTSDQREHGTRELLDNLERFLRDEALADVEPNKRVPA